MKDDYLPSYLDRPAVVQELIDSRNNLKQWMESNNQREDYEAYIPKPTISDIQKSKWIYDHNHCAKMNKRKEKLFIGRRAMIPIKSDNTWTVDLVAHDGNILEGRLVVENLEYIYIQEEKGGEYVTRSFPLPTQVDGVKFIFTHFFRIHRKNASFARERCWLKKP